MNDHLSEEALARAASDNASAISEAASGYAISETNAAFDPAFRYFILLTHLPQAIAPATPIEIFYARHYWFCVLIGLLKASWGPDAGLDQQAHQLLESAPPGVDWSTMENLEHQAQAAVERRLA